MLEKQTTGPDDDSCKGRLTDADCALVPHVLSKIDLTEFSPHGLLLLSSEFEFLKANRAFFELTHLRAEEASGRDWLNCLPHLESQSIANALSGADWHVGSGIELECQLLSPLGKRNWVKVYAQAIGANRLMPSLYVLTFEDIDVIKRVADQNQQLARVDSLTGLPNRRDFEDALTDCIQQPTIARSILAVLFVDLDGFKQVNDSFGHEAGDELLKSIARTIESFSARAAKVARLGGDEFTILLTDVKRIEEVKHYASKLILLLQQTISVKDVQARVSASIGIAIHHKLIEDRRGTDRVVTDLLRHADHAMYAAKESGKNCYCFYGDQNQSAYGKDSLKNKDSLIRSLYRALQNNELYVLYQPQVETISGEVIGCEALLRWQHHLQGMISPSKFIPVVESSGAINELTIWLIESICHDIAEIFMPQITSGERRFTVSVNLSPVQLQNRKTLETIHQIIDTNSIASKFIKFEITEHTLISDPRLAADGLAFLRDCGYRISLDDFGTGYSSLSYLHRFPFDEIKLDGSFISDVENNKTSQTVVRGVVALAHELGLNVVAEGVERQAQLDFLTEVGCGLWQGFLRSAGVHPEELLSIHRGADSGLQAKSAVEKLPAERIDLRGSSTKAMV